MWYGRDAKSCKQHSEVIRSACQQCHAADRKVDNLELTGKVTAESLRKAAVYVFNGNPAHCDTFYQIATGAEGAPKADTFKFEQAFDYVSQKPSYGVFLNRQWRLLRQRRRECGTSKLRAATARLEEVMSGLRSLRTRARLAQSATRVTTSKAGVVWACG
jgi:hypothetical protein